MGGLFDLETLERDIAEYDNRMTEPTFWDNAQQAQTVISEANELKEKYNQYKGLVTEKEDLDLLLEMVKEENDEELAKELNSKITPFLDKLDQYELDLLLSDPYDKNNAILELFLI